MATASVSYTPECCICFEIFKTPKILPCGHTFCLKCIPRRIDYKTGTVTCPICKQHAKIPKGGAKDFTTNYILQTSKYTTQVRDQPPSTTQHKCPNHNQREVDYYCNNCNVGLCSMCIHLSKQHKNHETLDLECDETRNEAIEKLQSSRKTIRKRIKHLEETRSTLLESFEQVKSLCDDSCAKVTAKTEQIVSDLRQSCNQIIKDIRNNLERNRSKVEYREMEITSDINLLESNMESNISPSTKTTLNILQTLPRLLKIETLGGSRRYYNLCLQYLQWVGTDFSLEIDQLGSVISKPFYIPDIRRKHVPKIKLHGERHAVKDTRVKIQDNLLNDKRSEDTIPQRGTLEHLHYQVTNSGQKPPAYWNTFNPRTSKLRRSLSTGRNILNPINSYSSLYKCIENLVQKTWRADRCGHGRDAVNLNHKHIQITSIERVQNDILYDKYCARRHELFSKTPCTKINRIPNSSGPILTTKLAGKELTEDIFPEVNEHYGFHGTSRVENITQHGFDLRYSGDQNLFGPAVYMSESSTKADQYADPKQNRTPGPKKMIMGRMLLGNPYLCTSKHPPKYKRPPCTDLKHMDPNCEHGHELFDSVMADGSWLFREFALFDNSSVYPEYIITYIRI